jgi:glycerophosphoryl diester phosphodiesterase
VRLKWHKLRRKPDDPPFARANLCVGLGAGASLEVDLRRLACGRLVCLHDADLAGETTGHGPVAGIDARAIAALEMRHAPGEKPLFLDELANAVREGAWREALVQLDLKAGAGEIDAASSTFLAAALDGIAKHFILSGCDWDAVTCLGGSVAGLALGYDPSEDVARDPVEVVRDVRTRAPEADTIYLHRDLVRAAHERGDPLVVRLHEHGHRVDCWTIDHGSAAARADLRAAIAAGCDQITTNSAEQWARASL